MAVNLAGLSFISVYPGSNANEDLDRFVSSVPCAITSAVPLLRIDVRAEVLEWFNRNFNAFKEGTHLCKEITV